MNFLSSFAEKHPKAAEWFRKGGLSSFSVGWSRPLNPHAFRHSAASALIANHVDVVTVSKVLGHASPNTTGKFYSHLIEDAKAAAMHLTNSATRAKGEYDPNKENQYQDTPVGSVCQFLFMDNTVMLTRLGVCSLFPGKLRQDNRQKRSRSR